MWSPGPIDVPDPPIDVAAVNPWMLRMAGRGGRRRARAPAQHADRTCATRCSRSWRPARAGAGRSVDDLAVIVPTFAAPGATADEVAGAARDGPDAGRLLRVDARTTPSSSTSSAGRAPRRAIREKQKAGDLAGMAAVIDDDLLEHFCVSGDWATVADGLIARHQGVATRVVSYFAGMAWARDPAALGPWGELAAVRAA